MERTDTVIEDGILVQRIWFTTGELRVAITNIDGIRYEKHLFKSGRLHMKHSYNTDEKMHGPAQCWYKNSQMQYDCTWENGKKVGLDQHWYENGQKKHEINFMDGKINGLARGWYENGQTQYETNFADGKQHGLFLGWYGNGQNKHEINCMDGKRNGLDRRWYENGQKEIEIYFIDDKEHGFAQAWHENGQVSSEGLHNNGKSVYGIGFRPDGIVNAYWFDNTKYVTWKEFAAALKKRCSKLDPMEKAIPYWMHPDRLMARAEAAGISVDSDEFNEEL
jgi:antitoxin component YwqK of YwqJK toxin-antitoxin module